MRAVLQRVTSATVAVDGAVVAAIDAGLVVLVGVAGGDGPADIEYIASKIREARIFADGNGRMNQSVVDVKGSVLVVSQFTLLGDIRKGRRPAFDGAEAPEVARLTYESLVDTLRSAGLSVATGQFRAHMQVSLVNDGPVTLLLDSRRLF